MKNKTFNLGISFVMFILGALYILSDGASVTANVIGASGADAGLTSIIGIIIVVGAIGLFIVEMHSTSPSGHRDFRLERLVKETKDHDNLNVQPSSEEYQRIAKEEEIKSKEAEEKIIAANK
jgi:hypothetical protein